MVPNGVQGNEVDPTPQPEHCSATVYFLKPKYRVGNPKTVYFHYVKKYFQDESIQIMCYLILKTEALLIKRMKAMIDLKPSLNSSRTLSHRADAFFVESKRRCARTPVLTAIGPRCRISPCMNGSYKTNQKEVNMTAIVQNVGASMGINPRRARRTDTSDITSERLDGEIGSAKPKQHSYQDTQHQKQGRFGCGIASASF